LSQLPPPGWYADPHGSSAHRWWDGLTWTAHTNGAQATQAAAAAASIAPAPAQQDFFGGTVPARQPQYAPAQPTPYSPMQPTPYGPGQPMPYGSGSYGSGSQAGGWHRNEFAFLTFGIVGIYVFLAMEAHVYILGIVPVMMGIRSQSRREPLAILAIIAAAVALVIGVVGFSHR
jgi:Protein of unknown function (DUF2510)